MVRRQRSMCLFGDYWSFTNVFLIDLNLLFKCLLNRLIFRNYIPKEEALKDSMVSLPLAKSIDHKEELNELKNEQKVFSYSEWLEEWNGSY